MVYYKQGKNWAYQVVNRNKRSFEINLSPTQAPGIVADHVPVTKVAVTAVDRTGNESALKEIDVKN